MYIFGTNFYFMSNKKAKNLIENNVKLIENKKNHLKFFKSDFKVSF